MSRLFSYITCAGGGRRGYSSMHVLHLSALTLLFAVLSLERTEACSYVVVGKRASDDGSLLVSYQNDYTGNTPFEVSIIAGKNEKKATQPRPNCRNAVGIPSVPVGGTRAAYAIATPAIREAFLNTAGLGMNYGVTNAPTTGSANRSPPIKTTGRASSRCKNDINNNIFPHFTLYWTAILNAMRVNSPGFRSCI